VDLAAGRTDTDIRYEFLRGWYEKSSRHDTVVISSPDSARAYGSAVDWFRKNDEEFRSRNPDVTPFRPGTPLLSAIPVPGDDVHTLAEVEKHLDHIREVIAKYPAKTVTYGDGQGWPARVGSKNSEAVETGIDLSMSVFRAEWYKHGPTLIQAMGHAVHTKAPEGGYSKDHGPRLALVTSITRENAFGYKDHYEIEVVAAARAKNFELNADPNINPTFSRIVERQLEENSRQGKRGLSQHQRDRLMKEHEVEFIEFIEIVKGTFDNVLAYGARANQVLGPSRGDGYILTIREVMVVQQYLRSIGIYKPMEDPLAVPVVSRSAGANAHISNGVDRGDVPEARDPGHLSVSPELTRSGMYLPKQLQKKIHPALTTYERNRADADAAALGFTMVTAMNESLTSRASMARQHTALYAEHTPRHHMTLVQEEVEKAQRLCGILNQVLDDNGSSAFADVTDLKNGALLMTDEQRRSVEACWEELQLPITASRSRVAVPNDVLAWAVQNSPSMQLIAKPDHGWSNEKPQIHPGERVNRTDQLDDFDFAL
jgi:hypothetical protein